jgi:hypothetical protein
VIFGFLEVGDVIELARAQAPAWAHEHPHVVARDRPNNTLYVARRAGVFRRYDDRLRLTSPGATRSVWRLPAWFAPRGRPPLGYHGDPARWREHGAHVELASARRGQEFVLDTAHYPEARGWLAALQRLAIVTT